MFAYCAVSRSTNKQTNKQVLSVSVCITAVIMRPRHPECPQACSFQWSDVLPTTRPELSEYRDYIVNRVKAKINISK
jgi:hypothetical protein